MQALTRFFLRHKALVAISWPVIAVAGALGEAVTARGQGWAGRARR
jgi:hypothetical protein